MIFQIGIKLKQISPSTNCWVKVKINAYKQHANFQDPAFTQSGTLGFYNYEKGVKAVSYTHLTLPTRR